MAKLLLHAFVGMPVVHRHAGTVTPDQVNAVEAGEDIRIGAQQVVHRGCEARSRGDQQQRGDRRATAPSANRQAT